MTVFESREYTAPMRGDHFIAGGLPCEVGLPLTPAYIRPPLTLRAAVPPVGSTLAGITMFDSALLAVRSKPTVKLLLYSCMPVSCSRRRPKFSVNFEFTRQSSCA